ncbi:InlB B-repeat-containing protein [Rheinheimera sp. SA_1]|uniref:InlB B-repeat-containing protein n=1 Tax=Rheinheimera sp. SA_1 TaxID=1827365 RepID=UPI000AC0BA38|nr:hypothetical protein [Rheinheimera sp. SA_1]
MIRGIFIAMLGLFSLSGCGGGETTAETPTPPTPVSVKTVQLAINGSGAVQSSSGQTCRVNCTIETQSTSLQLEPKADDGAQFAGWLNDCNGTAACTLNLSTVNKASATAVFQPLPVNFKVMVMGAGQVQVSGQPSPCRDQCTYQIPFGTTLTFTASPLNGATFGSWSSLCGNAQGQTCIATVNQPQTLTVTFDPPVAQQAVTLNVIGLGQITSTALSTPCTGSCSVNVTAGTVLAFNAVPDAAQQFVGWSDPCQALPACSLTVTAPVTLTARFAPLATSQVDDSNFVTVTNPQSTVLLNYPLQFARPFVAGEIAQFPQLMLNGQPLPTQADVKQRHPDGSVRHAIISAVVPAIAAGASLKLNFVNQTTGRQQGAPDKTAMLAANYNFDATIEAKFADLPLHTVSARAMLQQDKFSYWTQGEIATTILLVDHSVDRSFDFGADPHRSVRPAFYATFWPALNKVQVRYVGEITNSLALQDQLYDLKLKGGQQNPAVLYQQAALPHQAMTRWTRQFWLGEQLPVVSLNHQLAYLSKTRLIPNFDSSREISDATIQTQYQSWQSKDSTLYEAGLWAKPMANAGGRPDLGLYPAWTVRWFYSGDWRLAEIALRQAELSGSWPFHVREGDASRTFDEAKTVSGLGKILSINQGGRPTGWIPRLNWHETAANDKIHPIVPLVNSGWRPDVAHHPDLASGQYLLTGDYYFLEQSLFSAAYTTMDNNAAAKSSTLGRGPTGSEGALYSGETRGQGWALRTRVHTASITPDVMPEQQYFVTLTNKALAIWEGMYNVTNTPNKDNALWTFGRNTIAPKEFVYSAGAASPLGQWVHGDKFATSYVSEYYDMTKTANGASPWMTHIVVLALGRAEELGFAAGPMKRFVGRVLAGPALETGFALELLSAYRQPSITQPNGGWYQSWLAVQDGYLPAYRLETFNRYQLGGYIDAEFGYDVMVWGTASYVTDLPGGEIVWQFYHNRLKDRISFNNNPKWAILPRRD